jgi:O-antigen ligase
VQVLAGGFIVAAGMGFLYVAEGRVGVAAVAAPVAVLLAVVLLNRPRIVFTILLVGSVVCEYRAAGDLSVTNVFFEFPATVLSPAEGLILLCAAGTGLQLLAGRRRLRWPEPFTIPIVILVFAMLTGAITGIANHTDAGYIRQELRGLAILVLLPFVVANTLESKDLKLVLKVALGLVAIKAATGLLLLGQVDPTAQVYGTAVTFLNPTGPWLMMTFLLCMLSIGITRAPVSKLAVLLVPLAIATLIYSLRRGFWIGTLAGAAVVVVIATGRLGRRMLVPVLVVIGVAGWLLLSSGLVKEQFSGPVAKRISSLDPTSLSQNTSDNYRLAERRNVLANIAENPIEGLGLGARWTARSPTPVEYPNARLYTHIVALYFWLKMGLAGLLAYLGLFAAGMWAAYSVGRRHPDPLIRAIGFGLCGALVGSMVKELTETNTGVDPSFTIVLGTVFGLLAIARADMLGHTRATREARPPDELGLEADPTVSRV